MGGLQRLCKIYGRIQVKDKHGNSTMWVWDYKNDKPMLESEMTKEKTMESDKAKYNLIKEHLVKENKLFGELK